MKLFMILYVANGIGGTWGPLPYDMDECLARAVEGNAKVKSHEHTKLWEFSCELRAVRPQLGERDVRS